MELQMVDVQVQVLNSQFIPSVISISGARRHFILNLLSGTCPKLKFPIRLLSELSRLSATVVLFCHPAPTAARAANKPVSDEAFTTGPFEMEGIRAFWTPLGSKMSFFPSKETKCCLSASTKPLGALVWIQESWRPEPA